MMRLAAIALLLCVVASVLPAGAQRRITPVNTAATTTQSRNELRDDTAAINARRRATSVSYTEGDKVVWVDTITGDKWVDSLAQVGGIPKMQYPLLHSVSVGVDIWDAAMRIFGQDYGITGLTAELNMHNRYIPVVDVGVGSASHTPSGGNYTYRSPLSPYFRVGAMYNFLYNSNPDYMLMAGLRFGFSSFRWEVRDVTVNSPYWQETATFNIPMQTSSASWLEINLGLRVKLWGPISAGWIFKFRSMMHCGTTPYGQPWYVPGYGSRTGSIGGAFLVTYTIPLRSKKAPELPDDIDTLSPTAPSEPGTDAEAAAPTDSTAVSNP